MNSKFEVVVRRKRIEAPGICSLELADAAGRPLPSFSAGSHVDVRTPAGPVRQYSLCNDPDESHRYVIAVLKDEKGRGGSRSLHDEVSEGDRLAISAPRNHFALSEGASHSILLAGGIGVTPILCMAQRLARVGASFEMHYCTRSLGRTAFFDSIAASAFAPRVHLHF